jgi:uncharacterized Zn finger protein
VKCVKCSKPSLNKKIIEQDGKAALLCICRICGHMDKKMYSVDFDKIVEYVTELDGYLDKYKI